MYFMAHILSALGYLIHYTIYIYTIIIFISVFISWVNPDPYNPIVQFIRRSTEPVFFWFRRRLPLIIGGIDFSPILAIALLYFIDQAFASSLIEGEHISASIIIANIIIGIGQSIYMIINFYMWIVIIAAIITFIKPKPYNPIVRFIIGFLYGLTNPLFSRVRKRLPLIFNGIDFSPLIVILIIYVINNILVMKIIEEGMRLKIKGGF